MRDTFYNDRVPLILVYQLLSQSEINCQMTPFWRKNTFKRQKKVYQSRHPLIILAQIDEEKVSVVENLVPLMCLPWNIVHISR